MTSVPDISASGVDLSEAARQLELAVHDAQVGYDCVALGNLDRAHEHAITARIAADAAETILRTALGAGGEWRPAGELPGQAGEQEGGGGDAEDRDADQHHGVQPQVGVGADEQPAERVHLVGQRVDLADRL